MRALVSITNDGQLVYGGMVDGIDIRCAARVSHILFTETDIAAIVFNGNPITAKEGEAMLDGEVIPNYISLKIEDK